MRLRRGIALAVTLASLLGLGAWLPQWSDASTGVAVRIRPATVRAASVPSSAVGLDQATLVRHRAAVHALTESVARLPRAATATTTPPVPAEAVALSGSGSAPAATSPIAPRPGLATLGRILIPAIGLDQPLYEGIAQYFIDAGPTHWPGTALPGAPGNMVIAGHRTTHTHPFYAIANLHVGDSIIVRTNAGHSFTYRVDQQFVVPNTALWIKDPLPGSRMTIFTCHPIGSSAQRLVTRATLVASS
jgi:sortase A